MVPTATGVGVFRGWRLREDAELACVLAALPEAPSAGDIARLSWLPPDAAANRVAGMAEPGWSALDVEGEVRRTVVAELESSHPWERAEPMAIVQANSTGHDMQHFETLSGTAHGSQLVELEDAVLVGFDALFVGQTLHGRYTDRSLRFGTALRLARDGASGASRIRPLHRTLSGALFVDRPAIVPAATVEAPVLFGTPDEGANWGMWLLFAIASADLFHRHRDRYAHYLAWAPHAWQRGMLDALGIREAELLQQDLTRPMLLRRVGLLQQSHRDLIVTPWQRGCIERFLDRVGITCARPFRRIYVSRQSVTRAGAYRGLIGEDELAGEMARRGLDVVFPERLSFLEQARLFRESELVVGVGGAAMFNTVFCRPGARVVTIEASTVFAPWHCNIFASLGLAYGVILGERDPADPTPVHGRWALDMPRALEGLDAMLAGSGSPG